MSLHFSKVKSNVARNGVRNVTRGISVEWETDAKRLMMFLTLVFREQLRIFCNRIRYIHSKIHKSLLS
jgi:hypothetical protein